MNATKKRTVRLTSSGGLVITQEQRGRRTVDAYFVSPVEADPGRRAFRLAKHDGKVYLVVLGPADADADVCNCPGNEYHGHCKHAESLQALIACGKF
jgi:hypothetical protein